MGLRRQAREAALQILYLSDVAKINGDESARIIWAGMDFPPRARRFADALAAGTLSHRMGIDALITRFAENWEIGRMAAIDRNLIRLAAFELLHEAGTPVSVVIDEAVEMAKTFSTQDSGKFVNGILDKIKAERPAPPPAPPDLSPELF